MEKDIKELQKILEGLLYKGFFILSDGSFSGVYVDIVSLPITKDGMGLSSKVFVKMLKKLDVDKIVAKKGPMDSIVAEISRKAEIPLLLASPQRALFDHKIRGKYKKGDRAAIVSMFTISPSIWMSMSDTLRHNGVDVRYLLVLLNRRPDMIEELSEEGIELISIFELDEKKKKFSVSDEFRDLMGYRR